MRNLTEDAIDIFGRDLHEQGYSILNFMVTPDATFSVVPSHCENCSKKFRFYRKQVHINDKYLCMRCANV